MKRTLSYYIDRVSHTIREKLYYKRSLSDYKNIFIYQSWINLKNINECMDGLNDRRRRKWHYYEFSLSSISTKCLNTDTLDGELRPESYLVLSEYDEDEFQEISYWHNYPIRRI